MKTGKLNQSLIYISLVFTLLMIAARMIYTRELYGLYLVWNLFLAWLPFACSLLLDKAYKKSWHYFLVLGVWLLFFPNAPYIITDFFHLEHRSPVPYWYDLLILFWASWNGLMLGFISLMNVEYSLSGRFSAKAVNAAIYIFIALCAFGVYAGRYLRWNSWDVVTNPGNIISDVKFIALNPEDNLRTWGVTFFFSLLMIICYKTLKSLQHYRSSE
ncbi:MAG: DUF1361 domain-containing protein [Chitinophagaceae bacterium]|nr:DUF1361 domain-containing protein [Chitinophagaceae bacterium]